jgi:hypothetical protein
MKSLFSLLIALTGFTSLFAQNNVNFSASDNWTGYMNVFELPANGGGYVFGSAWGVADLKTVIDSTANTITLKPNYNTYADNPTDPFWVDTVANVGKKFMEASTFVEPGATFNGNALTFSGTVLSNTLDTNYTASFFIKALDPANGYQDAFGGNKVTELPASGNFTVSATSTELASGLIVQYGFVVKGRNGNPADEQGLGSVVISAPVTAISSFAANNDFSISPNPASQTLTLNSSELFEDYRIFNTVGQLVLSGRYNNQIDISAINAGNYYIELSNSAKKSVKAFVKK